MSLLKAQILLHRDDESEQQAPSAIINASKSLVRWQYLLGVSGIALAFGLGWFMLLNMQSETALRQLHGMPARSEREEELISAGVGLLPLLNAVACLRCGAALRKLVQTGLLRDLHPAMSRLRAVWRTFALTILFVFLSPFIGLLIIWFSHRQ